MRCSSKAWRSGWAVLGVVLAAGGGCASPTNGERETTNSGPERVARASEAASTGRRAVELPGLALSVPSSWSHRDPSGMRAAEYVVPGSETSAEPAGFVVYYFGEEGAGTVAANFDRWASQFVQPDGGNSRERMRTLEHRVDGMRVRLMELDGTYVAETNPGSGDRLDLPGYRLRAAIVDTAIGPYYIKFVGPASVVDRWDEEFDRTIVTMRATPVRVGAASAGIP